jgi:hypothetical protein
MSTAALVDGGTYRLIARPRRRRKLRESAPVDIHVARNGLAAWDKNLKAPKCATAGIQCWTGGLVVRRGPLGPEPKAPNTLGSSCGRRVGVLPPRRVLGRDRGACSGSRRGAEGARGRRIEVKVWATASFPTDRLDVFVAQDAKSPAWTLLDTLTPSRAGPQVLAVDHVLGTGSLQAVRAQLRHAGAPADGCSPGEFDDRDDLAFAVRK